MMRGKPTLLTPDALLPLTILPTFATFYTDPLNSTHPEASPLYMDYAGLPPLFFITSKEDTLMNDTTMIAERTTKLARIPPTIFGQRHRTPSPFLSVSFWRHVRRSKI
ncbi:MAG: alpha/beta hydrolase fold domain-containing protein [Zhongshania sp.]|nr:alpha/beta hydrolase fold domain-containing protein [Zhongshania sp.]